MISAATGRPTRRTGRFFFDMLITDVIGLMNALAIERTTFCATSMGGATAMGLAQEYAARLNQDPGL